MLTEILLAIIQSITEFLPISSSGHLALFSNIFTETNLFLFTVLHFASLIAVIIYTRREIYELITLKDKKLWLYLIIATIPAGLVGYFFNDLIEGAFSSYLFLGIAFILTGSFLYLTKFVKMNNEKLSGKNTFIIGLAQVFALFPGISRSGTTITTALLQNVDKERAAKFSFLLFIPLSIGALLLEALKLPEIYINSSLVVSFLICLVLSVFFLNLLVKIIRHNYFWMFSFYCWVIGVICLIVYVL